MSIVIGDLHGCFLTFQALLKQLPANEEIFLTGDLIDRGPRSKEIIDYLIQHPEIKCVQGNHERMLLDVFDNRYQALECFLKNGGNRTLDSYGLGVYQNIEIPEEHENYLRALPMFIETNRLIISHTADIGDNWTRSFIIYPQETKKFHVFGHTPLKKPYFTKKYCCIDTGCFYLKEPGWGKLTAIHYPSKKLYVQENVD